MNNELIEKVIKSSNQQCPSIVYKNPVLDRNVARTLSSSFIKILAASEHHSKINNNLRHSILENIKRMCQIDPQNHVTLDDNLVQCLTELYQNHSIKPNTSHANDIDRQLDAFLIRRFTEMDIHSISPSSLNPEIIQALINLHDKGVYLDKLSDDIIHWHVRNGNYECILKEYCDPKLTEHFNSNEFDDIALKMKPYIEKLLLNVCLEILTKDMDLVDLLTSNTELDDLLKKSGSSQKCFQICAGILNFVFIMTNFDMRMQIFIGMFIGKVKCFKLQSMSMLYPVQLNNLVLLLDFDISILPEPMKKQYINATLIHLNELRKDSESDLILLLSHFPQWFDIYFGQSAELQSE